MTADSTNNLKSIANGQSENHASLNRIMASSQHLMNIEEQNN